MAVIILKMIIYQKCSESNIKLQWIMMVITLIVALCSINNSAVINEIKNLIEKIEIL